MKTSALTPKSIEILLVEDSDTDRMLALEALRESRLANALHCVVDGVEALAFLRREGKYKDAPRPDLILLDLNMPRKDGREVLAEIKEDDSLRLIPVVVLTTSKADEDVLEAYGHHANCYVTKPLDFERFGEIARQLDHFWFEVVTLPPQVVMATRERGRSRPAEVLSAPLFGAERAWKVLIIEDSPSDALLIEEALTESVIVRFDPVREERVADAEARLARESFDVIVTDLALPDSQGMETLNRVRHAGGETPVIVLTVLEDERTGLDLLREGAADYIVKGQISGRALARAIRYAIDRGNIQAQLRHAQRMESIGTLAGGVAHDFNNLLTIIRGNAQLQTDVVLDAEGMRNTARQITAAADRAAALTRQLLAFSRRERMKPVALDLNTVVGDFTKMLRRLLGPTIQMEMQLAADPLGLVGDAGMIEQVIMNLAVNARDAMPAGGRLTLRTERREIDAGTLTPVPPAGAGAYVCLAVADTGAGMAPAVLAHIFEPFFTTKEVGHGTGLGLSTVYGIMQQHRGAVTVKSTVGAGTEFTVFFPSVGQAASSVPTARTSDAAGGAETILLVDDEDMVRELAAMILRMKGYTVIEANSGAEALAAWPQNREKVDLVITDLMMPDGVSGVELGRLLVETKPTLKVIYTSGYSSGVKQAELKLVEGGNFIGKPYGIEDLSRIVRAQLGG